MIKPFDVPVVVFFFNRQDLILRVIDRISEVKPKKMYLISDGARNEEERIIVQKCREAVEKRIDWGCEVIKNYAKNNRGVYENIGKGARWVFQKEKKAIFLEDDNLPEITFFEYCKEMLDLYEFDRRILWICGTNYLEKYNPMDNSSYVFTKHLMPCGWASWSNKFLDMYDGDLNTLDIPGTREKLLFSYENKALFRQQIYAIEGTKDKLINNKRLSWDHQMCYSIRINSALGIAPKYNLITNIGVDSRSTHGGTTMKKTMTRRFCEIESHPLEFPLIHPKQIAIDSIFEQKTANIILMPLRQRIIVKIVRLVKPFLGFEKYESVSLQEIRKRIHMGRKF